MAATNTNIKINIVEPGGSTPVDHATGTTDISVPDTGLFTHSIGGPEATAIGAVLIITIAAIVVAILYRKQKKSGKVTKLVHLVDSTKAVLKSKKRITTGLTAIALLASAGTLTTLLANAGKSNTNAIEEDGLTLDVSSEDFTIEVGDEPVFAVLPVELTVEEATEAGYTLTAYTDNTDLVSTTDSSKVIPMVAASEGELAPLTDNTYGLALDEKPTTKDAEVYMPLSIDSDVPTVLKATDYVETEANDTTTIYYGFYITPDVPYGTYEGSEINYEAEPNYITNLSFNGNGNDGGVDMEGMTIIAGDTITLPENTYTKEGYNFIGWNTAADGTSEAYADETEFTAAIDETQNVTLYAQWEEALPVIGDLTYMQDFASLSEEDKASVLNSMTEDEQYQLKDNRDQKDYYISKLKDGNVWMTQNLDFNIVNGGVTLNSTNTDVPVNWADAGNLANTYATDDTTWDFSETTPESYDPGDMYWNGALIYDGWTCEANGGEWRYRTCNGATVVSSVGDAHYHVGNYYNWTASVAMSDSSSLTVQEDINQSICPAGWRSPTISGNKSYQNLVDKQSLIAGVDGNMQNDPTYFVYGGAWFGMYSNGGMSGLYWVDGLYDNKNHVYRFYYDSDGRIYPQNPIDAKPGYFIRCVVR